MFDADIRYLEDKRDKYSEKSRLKWTSGEERKKRGWCMSPRSDAVVGKHAVRQGLKRKTDERGCG